MYLDSFPVTLASWLCGACLSMVFNTVLIFERISGLWPSDGRPIHRTTFTLYNSQHNKVHECTIPVQYLQTVDVYSNYTRGGHASAR